MRSFLAVLLAVATLVPARSASAQGPAPADTGGDAGKGGADGEAPPWAGTLDTRKLLLGDIDGLRPALDRHGISFGLSETTETLANPTGGIKRGAVVEGLTQMSVGADLSKAFGLEGAIMNVSAYQIHGRGLTARNLSNLNVASSIEAEPSTRLNELWIQQTLLGGTLDVKVGQQSVDFEFITSEYEDLFVNSGFGWPTLPAIDLPSGGPAYPLPDPGVRLRLRPTQSITALLGVFDGSPAGLRPGDPQRNDPSGINFDLSSGALLIGEVQYRTAPKDDASALPGTYKLGAWYNTNRFADAFFQHGDGAQPPGVLDGIPGSRRGDWSLYGTLDQLLYRPGKDDDAGLALTARAMGAPADRNVVDLFLQGGFVYKGPFGRADDSAGIVVEWARIGSRARAGDVAAAATDGTPVRSAETVIEATYQLQVEPWWHLQPDVQYVFSPGGGLPDPRRPTRPIGDAAVVGLRSVVTF